MVEKDTINELSDFEKERFPCLKEWWCVEGFFTTIQDDKKWSFKADLYQAIMRTKHQVSVYSITIFDLDDSKIYRFEAANEFSKLESEKDKFFIKYDKSYIKGLYPNYQMFFDDQKNKINLELKYTAQSSAYWLAESITNGRLPWGIGDFRYGFIPRNELGGNVFINGKKLSLKGTGYFEHIWGDFTFLPRLIQKRSKKTISTYAKLADWWIHNQKIKISNPIVLSTDNRPFGYDWVWGVLDNGWSFFYGNLTFWIAEGPSTGIFILSKDGEKNIEFGSIKFKYLKMKYLSDYDFYYPIELEITATKDNKKLYFHLKNTSKGIEEFKGSSDEKKFPGFTICQVPCALEGYYFDGLKRTKISGFSKMEFHRMLNRFGHNLLKIELKLSKNLFGFSSDLDAHYLGKTLDFDLQVIPKPKLKINFNKSLNHMLKK